MNRVFSTCLACSATVSGVGAFTLCVECGLTHAFRGRDLGLGLTFLAFDGPRVIDSAHVLARFFSLLASLACHSLELFQYTWFGILVAGHTYVDGDLLSVRRHQQQVHNEKNPSATE